MLVDDQLLVLGLGQIKVRAPLDSIRDVVQKLFSNRQRIIDELEPRIQSSKVHSASLLSLSS